MTSVKLSEYAKANSITYQTTGTISKRRTEKIIKELCVE